LLEVKPFQSAVVFLGDAKSLEYRVVQFLLGIRRVHDEESHQEHSLVTALQVLQEFFGFPSVGGQIGRQNIVE
jgi:hypothetical protein